MSYKGNNHPLPAVELVNWLRARHEVSGGPRKLLIGQWLLAWRGKFDLSREEAATITGIDVDAIKRLERGENIPNATTVAEVMVAALKEAKGKE